MPEAPIYLLSVDCMWTADEIENILKINRYTAPPRPGAVFARSDEPLRYESIF